MLCYSGLRLASAISGHFQGRATKLVREFDAGGAARSTQPLLGVGDIAYTAGGDPAIGTVAAPPDPVAQPVAVRARGDLDALAAMRTNRSGANCPGPVIT